MNIKPYIKGMLFIAMPATILGVILAFSSIHSGGVLFKLAFLLVPGLWFINYIGLSESNYSWGIVLFVQILFWSAIILILNHWVKKTLGSGL